MYNEAIKIWREKNREDLLNKFLVKFIYCSNKIKNYEITFSCVEGIFNGEKIDSFKGNKKIIKEIESQKKLCENIFNLSKGDVKLKLSIGVIEQVYYVITGNKLERNLYVSIEKLVKDINSIEINDDNALEAVSYFVCYFQEISNCDGRVVRILLNYILVANHLPPINIFYMDKEKYYLAMDFFIKKIIKLE
ncbi:Fic family protein [Clostridium sp. JS66]|uniref:Fic family protein n=1 Tax=Clostridium sp. JS66 TaxID=3064705 RepID=UPI00298E1484|nr:Fic family protein [Clostridium sp. JS66]WPC42799.1 Fic family protein [Clostridium sp. JS66]